MTYKAPPIEELREPPEELPDFETLEDFGRHGADQQQMAQALPNQQLGIPGVYQDTSGII